MRFLTYFCIYKYKIKMGKMEKATEKRMFTTYSIHEKITNNLKALPGIKWEVQQYNYLYVVHKIISHINLHKEDELGKKINIEYLAILFGKSNSATAEILRNLIKWKILVQSLPSKTGCSARYLLSINHKDDRIIIFVASILDASFIDKIIKHKEKNLQEDKFILKSYNIIKSSLSVNSNGYNYLNNKYDLFGSNNNILLLDGYPQFENDFLVSKSQLLDIKKKKKLTGGYGIERRDIPLFLILINEPICKRPLDRNGNKSRVYNNITNLPREHRQYVNFCGKPLLMTDISNSQILLTVPMIEKPYKIYSGMGAAGIPDDVIKFKQWAESGEFYENFSKVIYHGKAITITQRKELKIMIFRVLWFGRNSRFKKWNRVKSEFIKIFPNVYKTMAALKKADYRQFSIELQRFEASIIVDKVAKKLLVKHNVLTLHDAIVCNDDTILKEAEQLIKKAMAKYGLNPKFKREDGSISNQVVINEIENVRPPSSEENEHSIKDHFAWLTRDGKVIKPLQKRVY